MKKKIIKIFIISVVALLVVWLSLLITDSLLSICFNKKPIFATADVNTIQKDGGSGLYKGLGYSLKIKGTSSATSNELFNIYYTEIKIFNFTIYIHNSSN
ncbi:MAG: hypothetical protein RR325_03175 [Bacilli bacterium]